MSAPKLPSSDTSVSSFIAICSLPSSLPNVAGPAQSKQLTFQGRSVTSQVKTEIEEICALFHKFGVTVKADERSDGQFDIEISASTEIADHVQQLVEPLLPQAALSGPSPFMLHPSSSLLSSSSSSSSSPAKAQAQSSETQKAIALHADLGAILEMHNDKNMNQTIARLRALLHKTDPALLQGDMPLKENLEKFLTAAAIRAKDVEYAVFSDQEDAENKAMKVLKSNQGIIWSARHTGKKYFSYRIVSETIYTREVQDTDKVNPNLVPRCMALLINHPASHFWEGVMSRVDAQESLKDQPVGTWLLRKGSDDTLVLSQKTKENSYEHVNTPYTTMEAFYSAYPLEKAYYGPIKKK